MTDISQRVLAAFQMEHKEHLEGIRAILAGPAVAGRDLEEAFRLAHSLKAGARVCDLDTVERLGHQLEALFLRLRQGSLQLDQPVAQAIQLVLDAIEDWTTALAEKRSQPDPTRALQAVDRILASAATQVGIPALAGAGPASGTAGDINQQVLAAFQLEHKEHVEGMRLLLAKVEKGGASSSADLDEIFRLAHSLKGGARVVELPVVEQLGHRLETLCARIREGSLSFDRNVFDVIHQVLDGIEDWMSCLAENRVPGVPTAALTAVERLLHGEPETAAAEAPASPEVTTLRPAASGPALDTVKLSAESLDRLLRSSAQLLTEGVRQDLLARELSQLARQIGALEQEGQFLKKASASRLHLLAARPEFNRVLRYLELVEQNVRTLGRQARAVQLLQRRNSWALRLLGEQVQRDVGRIRMVPADSVFQGFRKMMRDLARDEGKEIDFEMSGLEVQADRVVLQALKDPVMHLLRNAVSHGIETPEQRRQRGKGAAGRVVLQADTLGNRLRLRIEDDGRGIDFPRVAEVAVRLGLLAAEEAASATPEELSRFLLQPGFSTSRTVTELSGRGMGLSVVAETVKRLLGEVHFRPGAEAGAAVDLSVPLSVSTHRLLLVSCAGQTFALPLHAIERLLRIKGKDFETVEGRPVVTLRGRPVPLLSLARLLGCESAGESAPRSRDAHCSVIVLKSEKKHLAVAVDAILAEREGLIKDLDGPAARVPTFAGAILLEDGSVALVVNPAELIDRSRNGHRAHVSQPAEEKTSAAAGPPRATPTVLVVDDSFTTRTLEKSILETHGYRVRVAVDGVEALNQLRSEKVDLVVTDVQMPRMDGFALLAEMKKDPRLAQVPVIVVTSMDRREDQERGLALGAEAYIVKRKFDHQDLLNTIRQIL